MPVPKYFATAAEPVKILVVEENETSKMVEALREDERLAHCDVEHVQSAFMAGAEAAASPVMSGYLLFQSKHFREWRGI